jgi:hypothetical protein
VRVQLDGCKSRGREITKQRTPSPFDHEAMYSHANYRPRNNIAGKVSPARPRQAHKRELGPHIALSALKFHEVFMIMSEDPKAS